ncbi:methionyl-tRNA formyltransferase [Thermodesulfobacteriota bacterium]
MNIVYFGNNRRGVICLETLYKADFNIAAVVIHHGAPDEDKASSVHHLAKKLSLPVYDPKDVNGSKFLAKLREIEPGLMVLSGYNPILKKEILEIPAKGTINLHGGRLPYYRGGSPINWQIINGETIGGCAVFYVDEGIDTGDIIAQETYGIGPDEKAGEVIEKTLKIFPRLLTTAVRQIEEDRVTAIKQDHLIATYYHKRYPEDGRIDWSNMSAFQVHNLVRALNGPPLSGAFTFLRGEKIVIWETKLLEKYFKGVPGRIVLKEDDGVIVIAADHGILLTKIEIEHEPKIIQAKAFLKIGGYTFE